jgi:hypothetical protein
MRIAWTGRSDDGLLYARHFALFHQLSLWQLEFYPLGTYLHIHCMRIRLLDFPPQGSCRWYHATAGMFCGQPVLDGKNACSCHPTAESGVAYAPLAGYYLDKANFQADKETVLAMYRGLGDIAAIPRALDALGLEAGANWPTIRARYRELLRQYHPDTHGAGGDLSRLIGLQDAWKVLRRCHHAGGYDS